jgi:dephospho-CoA kinase
MIILGLTGSIGMGKSTVAAMFAEAGVPMFDADAEVHRLQGPGGWLLPEIEAMFPGTTDESGVNREALRAAVLADSAALARLEALIHPAVAAQRESFLAAHADSPLVVLDIPLLFEAGGWQSVDKIAVVSAPVDIQRERVLRRADMTPERLESILARQLPDAEKRARADYIIDTGGPLAETRAQVNALIACLIGGTGG